MNKNPAWLARVFVMLALGLSFAGASLAQTTTTSVDVRKFEVISVDGNRIVVRDDRGTNEYTVPNDFRFTVDGKKLSASELKPGMKGTATVTTTTTVKPVVVTEVRKGVVVGVGPHSVTVRDDADGSRKRFTQSELTERGLQIVKDGRVMYVGELKQGDEITATFVSQGVPEVVTEKDVQATLAQAPAPAQPKPDPTPATAAAPAVATTPPAAAPAQPIEAASAPAPAAASGQNTLWYVLIAVVIAGVLFFVMRRKKAP